MKFTCNREEMLAAYHIAAAVAPNRSPKPILQNVLLIADEQHTSMMATDMEIGVRIDVTGINIEVPGRVVLPVPRFGNILRESQDVELSIQTEATGTVVRGEYSEITLTSQDPAEFPEVAPFGEEKYHTIDGRLLKEIIRRTAFATDLESGRYALGGVLFEFEADKIVGVGTDGRRMAKMEGPAESVGGHDQIETPTIVPARALQFIERGFTDGEDGVRIAARGNDVLVASASGTLYSRLVEGRFPKWRDAFPKRAEAQRIAMTVGPLFTAVRQAAVVADDESRGIDFTFADGSLVLTGSSAEIGQSRVSMPIAYDGPAVTLTLDHRFVADFLKVLDSEKTFSFEIENGDAAALLATDDGYGYVIMPLARER